LSHPPEKFSVIGSKNQGHPLIHYAMTPTLPNLPQAISPIRAIAIILAHGVVRLHQRQKELDNRTEQSVHDCVLATKGETQ
jgi:hypothetical protein